MTLIALEVKNDDDEHFSALITTRADTGELFKFVNGEIFINTDITTDYSLSLYVIITFIFLHITKQMQ